MSLLCRPSLVCIFLLSLHGNFATATTTSPVVPTRQNSTSATRIETSSANVITNVTTRLPSIAAPETADDWNIWRTRCDQAYINPQRCTIYCEESNTACWHTANSIVSTCGPQWSSYEAVQSGSASSSGSEWSKITTEFSYSGMALPSTTVLVYTTFSTANVSFRKQDVEGHPTTITPVYAMGTPIESVSVNTAPPEMITYLTAPTPECKFAAVHTWNSSYCGQCRIQAGTVDLFYWPSATASAVENATESTAVVDGSTLVSPSVYISLRTIYAQDSCATVGRPHVGSMIALKSEDVSTIIHIGGKVAAYTTGALDYDILTGGLPPAKEYQMLPSCIMFGCKTMRPMTWSPTLVAPSQVRTLDASWAQCDLALEGFYDPPKALSGAHAAASPTEAQAPVGATASPCQTWRPVPVTPVPSSKTADRDENQSEGHAVGTATAKGNDPNGDAVQPSTGPEEGSTSTQTIESAISANVLTMTTSVEYGGDASPDLSASSDDKIAPDALRLTRTKLVGQDTDLPLTDTIANSGSSPMNAAPPALTEPYIRPHPLDHGEGVLVELAGDAEQRKNPTGPPAELPADLK